MSTLDCRGSVFEGASPELLSLMAYSFELLRAVTSEIAIILRENLSRDEVAREGLLVSLSGAAEIESIRVNEKNAMDSEDGNVYMAGNTATKEEKIEREKAMIAPLTRLDALEQTGVKHGTNNAPIRKSLYTSNGDLIKNKDEFSVAPPLSTPDKLTEYTSAKELAKAISEAHSAVHTNLRSISVLMARKDHNFTSLREELTNEMVERRRREQEVINWSYILKHLLGTISSLRKQLKVESDVAGGGVELLKQVLENDIESVSEMENSAANFTTGSKLYAKPFSHIKEASGISHIQSEFQRNQQHLDQQSLHSLAGEVVKGSPKNKGSNVYMNNCALLH